MSKEEKNIVVPKCRFPEFIPYGGWEEKTLGSICSNIASGKDSIYENGEFDLYGSTGIIGKTDSGSYEGRFILVARVGANAGFLNRVEGKFGVTDNTLVIFLYESENIDFVYYTLEKTGLNKLVFGSGQPLITGGQLKNLLSHFPKPDEQHRIASCLSSLDDLITSHTQKLDALKAHKKGLIQQLFPAEGEKAPPLRFEEFKNSGEWEYSKIEDYIELLSGIPLKSDELSDDVSGVPILRGINITEGHIRHSKDIDKYFLGNVEEIKRYIIEENDLVIAMDGSKVGKNVALIKKEDEGSILIQRVARIRTNEKSDINYIYQHIFSEKFRNYVDKVNTSSGIPHISSQQIKEFKIGFPSLKEQQKIAACLSSLDEFITVQAKKIEQLKNHKKGLMQGLFPNNNEENT